MRNQIQRYLRHYLYGLLAKMWNNSITAADDFIGLAVGAAISSSIHAIDWRGAAAVFATTAVRSALQYFRDNPLPPKLPETEPPFPRLPPTDPASTFAKL